MLKYNIIDCINIYQQSYCSFSIFVQSLVILEKSKVLHTLRNIQTFVFSAMKRCLIKTYYLTISIMTSLLTHTNI